MAAAALPTSGRFHLAGDRLRCPCGKRHGGWHHIEGRDYASALCLRCALPAIRLLRELEDRLGTVRVQPVFNPGRSDRPPAGECPLTNTELEVLHAIAEGKTHEQIAYDSGRSHSTIRTHLVNVYAKFGVPGAAQAVLYAERRGWLGKAPDPLADVEYDPDLPELTPAQRVYLACFDEYLRAPTLDARLAMVQQLEVVCDEAAVKPKGRNRTEPPATRIRRRTSEKRGQVLELLQDCPGLTRSEIAAALEDARGLHCTLGRLLREGVLLVDETAESPRYELAAERVAA